MLVSALVVLGTAGRGAAQDQPPFSFAEQTTLTKSCADLVAGARLRIDNDSATAQPLHLLVSPLRDSEGNEHPLAKVCGGLRATVTAPNGKAGVAGSPLVVKRGRSAIITLSATSGPTLTKGQTAQTYSMSLTVSGESGRVARRTVVVSEADPVSQDAVPLIDSRSVTHHRLDPTDRWIIWLPVSLPATATLSLLPGTVGALAGEGQMTAVTYDGDKLKKLSDSTSLLPLHIHAVGAGSYSGKVDLTPNDPQTGAVTLSLTVKHWWPLAALCLLLGIAFALLVQRYNGFWGARGRLLKRVGDIDTRREQARQRVKSKAQERPWKDFDINDSDLEGLQQDLRDQITNRTQGTLIQIDQKVVDDLNAKIAELEAKVDQLAVLAAAALDVDEALRTLGEERPTGLPDSPGNGLEPRLATAAEALLKGASLTAEALEDRANAIQALVSPLRTLHAYEFVLAHYQQQLDTLEAQLPAGHEQEITALKNKLVGIRHGLWDADAGAWVDAVKDDLNDAREKIGDLWSFLPSAVPLRRHTRGGPMLLEATITTGFALRWPWEVGATSTLLAPPALPPRLPAEAAQPAPSMTEVDAARAIAGARWRQVAVIVVSAAVALISGLSALYVGKTWGTPWDYVSAIAWGLLTQAFILGLAGAIDGLGALGAVRQGVGAHRK